MIFQNAMTPSEVQAFVDLYDAEIRFTDSALGALLDFLDARGLSQRTVVLVTADHGESLGEHRYFFEHGDLGTQPEIHIPLIVRAPRLPAGRRIPWTVSSLDVAPTALDLVGISSEGAFRGTSLVPLVGEGGEDRSCMGETDQSLHEENDRREVEGLRGKWRWCRRGGFKLLHIPQAFGPPLRILHDLEADPGERQDFAAAHPEVRDALARELDAFLSEDKGQDREYHITDSAREILRSLGYVN